MRTAFTLFAAACLLAACSENNQVDTPSVVKGKTLVTLPVAPEKVKGTYTGDFKGSPIAITLNYISDNHASGYNVHKGLTRNISGSIEATPEGLRLVLAEPGSNQYDGKFDLLIDTATWSGKGTWTPFKKGDDASFTFKKKIAQTDEDRWGVTYTDSLLNSLTLNPDGSCTYSYLTDTTNTGQEITIRGNYTKDKNTYTIFWQKNEVFPQKSVFKMIETKPYEDQDYVEKALKGEGKLFTQMWD